MNYRIVIETQVSGKKLYYVQRRILFVWICYREEVGWDKSQKICMNSLEEAETFIETKITSKFKKTQQKIKSREYIYK